MPIIRITLIEGYDDATKRQLATRLSTSKYLAI